MEDTKVSLYVDDLMLYITKPDQSLPELFAILQEYSNISEYKRNYEQTSDASQRSHTLTVIKCYPNSSGNQKLSNI